MMKRFPCQGYQTCWIDSTSLLFWEVPLSLMILLGSMFFLSPTLDVIRMSMVTVFFLPQLDHGTKWDGFKSRVNKHLLYLCSLWSISLCFPLCFLLLLVLYFLCLAVAVQTYLEWISFKTKQTKTKTKHKNKQKGRYREHYMTNCSSLHFHSFWIIICKFFKWKKCLLFNLNSLLVRLG